MMIKNRKYLETIIILFLFAFPLVATTPVVGEDEDSLHIKILNGRMLEEVLVIAPLKRMSYRSAPLHSSLSSIALREKQPRTLPEALQGIPGVWVQKTDHGGGSPILRGMIGYQTIVLIDGIRMNNASFQSGPLPYMNLVNSLMVEQLTVLPGAGSVAYGSDAMGGVISFRSKSAIFSETKKFGVHGLLRGDAATGGMEYMGRGEVDIANNEWGIHVAADAKSYGDVHAGKGLGIESPSGYSEWATDMKLQRKFGQQHLLTAAYQGTFQHHVPSYMKMAQGKYDLYELQSRTRNFGYLSYAFRPQGNVLRHMESTLAYTQQYSLQLIKGKGKNITEAQNDKVHSWGWNADVDLQLLPCWNLKMGSDLYFDKIYSHILLHNLLTDEVERTRGNYSDASSMLSCGAFLTNEWQLRRWVLRAGVRYSYHHLSLNDDTFGDVSLTPDAIVGDVSGEYNFSDHLLTGVRIASTFRAPNINDMSTLGEKDSWYMVPNYNLSPERGFNTELFMKYNLPSTRFSVNVYLNRLSNLLARVETTTVDGKTEVNGFPVRMKGNINKACIWGFELAGEQRLSSNFSITANACYTHGQSVTDHVPLSKIPPLFGSFGLHWCKEKLYTSFITNMAAKQSRLSPQDEEDSRIPDGGTPGWIEFRLTGGYTLACWDFSATLGNLLNKAYRLHASGIDAYGRHAKLTVQYRF